MRPGLARARSLQVFARASFLVAFSDLLRLRASPLAVAVRMGVFGGACRRAHGGRRRAVDCDRTDQTRWGIHFFGGSSLTRFEPATVSQVRFSGGGQGCLRVAL